MHANLFAGSGRCPGLDPGGDLAQPANTFLREGYQGRRVSLNLCGDNPNIYGPWSHISYHQGHFLAIKNIVPFWVLFQAWTKNQLSNWVGLPNLSDFSGKLI